MQTFSANTFLKQDADTKMIDELCLLISLLLPEFVDLSNQNQHFKTFWKPFVCFGRAGISLLVIENNKRFGVRFLVLSGISVFVHILTLSI